MKTEPEQSEPKWTKEPWEVRFRTSIYCGEPDWVADCEPNGYLDESIHRKGEANARRIIACVNACAGMQDPEREIAELRHLADIAKLLLAGWTVTPASLYDEEGVEGWRWDGPNNRELYCMGDRSEPPTIPDELLEKTLA